MESKFILLVFLVFNCEIGSTSILDWVWQSKTDDTTVVVADGVPLVSIPYESMTEDEKFLQEAAKFTEIQVSSPLETCQHKVIMKIKTSCSAMTEEELAKLSVNLLNCQSAVEGRKMFPCTEEMSLKQCTTDMDADMWNAYHLMSNRARAVCYAARSTQFRALTELTVNKLMQSAHSQIEALSTLKQGQERLEEQTTEALSSLSKGNKVLLEQQTYLKDAQTTAHNLITTNLRELNNEKALIRSGHAQLATMAEDIRNKLEKAHRDLEQQAMERGENHREILQDLIKIQEQAQAIWEKIESSTNRILEQHEEAIEQYEETFQKLEQINNTIQYIWNLTNVMRTEVDQKLGWITAYIGDTGEQMQRVYRIFLHVMYILVAMIVAAFLQAPLLTRATIMSIVPINVATYLKHGMDACLDFTSMTILIFLITAMHFIMLGIQRVFRSSGPKTTTEPVKVTHQNGHASSNGDVYKYTSSSYSNSVSTRLHTKLIAKIQGLYNLVISQINHCTGKLGSLMRSIMLWGQYVLSVHEELSCSYLPSKKHDEVIYNYEHETPSVLSDDLTQRDSYNSRTTEEYDEEDDDMSNIADAFELKRRMRNDMSHSDRSGTPFTSPPKIPCIGITRAGRRCRSFVSPGQLYCHHHATGTSIIGDSY